MGEYVVIEIGNPEVHVRDTCSGRIGLEPTLQIRIPADRYGKPNGNRLEKIWLAGEEPVILHYLGLNKEAYSHRTENNRQGAHGYMNWHRVWKNKQATGPEGEKRGSADGEGEETTAWTKRRGQSQVSG